MPLGRKHLRRSRDAPNLWDGPCKELLPFYKKGSQALWDVSITETPYPATDRSSLAEAMPSRKHKKALTSSVPTRYLIYCISFYSCYSISAGAKFHRRRYARERRISDSNAWLGMVGNYRSFTV